MYDQPGVTYQLDAKGQRQPGYIEPLFAREEEAEYQQAYITHMYGYYGYGMWLVFDRTTGNLIGRAGLEHRDFDGQTELEMGYVIGSGMAGAGHCYRSLWCNYKICKGRTGFSKAECTDRCKKCGIDCAAGEIGICLYRRFRCGRQPDATLCIQL